ncbi:hypothetical protein TNCV_4245551 [Trichonephila clavipes]|nr:hypothetical protein TNCV_4245551 [Trichonephila clavipes]
MLRPVCKLTCVRRYCGEYGHHSKLKTKIENSSTFESDPDFVKTLIQNCIDEGIRFSSGLHGNTAADSVQSGWPLWHAAKSKTQSSRAGAAKVELKLWKLLN